MLQLNFTCWFGEKKYAWIYTFNLNLKCKYIKHNFPIFPYRFYCYIAIFKDYLLYLHCVNVK